MKTAAIAVLLLLVSGCAKQSEVAALKKQVVDLEYELSTAQQHLSSVEDDAVHLKNRVKELESKQEKDASYFSGMIRTHSESQKETDTDIIKMMGKVSKLESEMTTKAEGLGAATSAEDFESRISEIEHRLKIQSH